jgi:3-phenylpropionate/trans-cinnamate dioxygenase ferredoxin reductase component
MAAPESIVIVGASLAGAKAAEALRDLGYEGPVVLVGEEPDLPYERPPLSKSYLTGRAERNSVFVHEKSWYDDNRIELRLGVAATGLDRATHEVQLDDGNRLKYGKLLLATGSRPRPLPVPGGDLDGVLFLRRLGDSDRIKEAFGGDQKRVVIVGAGWIGLETAAAAREAGNDVAIVEQFDLPLLRVLGPEMAQVFADLHRDHGVDLHLGVGVREIEEQGGHVAAVHLDDGVELAAGVVIAGVGITPAVDLAQEAGLDVDNGIVVDEHLRSSDPAIYAAGDVANAYHPLLDRHVRVEHWANALNQPAVAAAAMLGGDAVYDRVPYCYTDQYDLGMEYLGYVTPGGYDEVVIRGDVPAREFVAFWMSDGRLLAGMNVNVWDVADPIRALIQSRVVVGGAQLADTAIPLTQLVDLET